MATYAIGDIQGCYDELQRLLELIQFDPTADHLWFVGDLVNRGPKSTQVLRFIKGLGDRAITVLGNHDLHLLAVAIAGRRPKPGSSLEGVLNAPDREELLEWLRFQPLMHVDRGINFSMIHAGLPPQWSIAQARKHAAEVESALRHKKRHRKFFAAMYGDKPDRWSDDLQGMDRLRFITNCFTRLRYCTKKGKLVLNENGPLGSQRNNLLPWFMAPQRRSARDRIVFGHWSTLGYMAGSKLWSLDTGCLWGGQLTALRLEDQAPFFLNCSGKRKPGKG